MSTGALDPLFHDPGQPFPREAGKTRAQTRLSARPREKAAASRLDPRLVIVSQHGSVSPMLDNLSPCGLRWLREAGPRCSELAEDGSRLHDPVPVKNLSAAVAEYERAGAVRWVWASSARLYPALLRPACGSARCHDVELAERLLRSRNGQAGGFAASLPADHAAGTSAQDALFDPADAAPADLTGALDELITAHAEQLRQIAADESPARFGMLVAAESAGGLVAAEMSFRPALAQRRAQLAADRFARVAAASGAGRSRAGQAGRAGCGDRRGFRRQAGEPGLAGCSSSVPSPPTGCACRPPGSPCCATLITRPRRC